ncbi:unnamed protein product [Linum tenue]|uniref:Uncharacterized protein n=1 Tax=Linum tenue TaxID=586396 RepID=A0AAV0L3C1_9ROSI|nr:unnamed protein product [Linum tenue]
MAVAEIQDTPYLLSSCTNLLLWQQRRWIRWAGSDPDGTTSSFTNGLSGSRSRMHPRSLTYGPKECRSRGSAALKGNQVNAESRWEILRRNRDGGAATAGLSETRSSAARSEVDHLHSLNLTFLPVESLEILLDLVVRRGTATRAIKTTSPDIHRWVLTSGSNGGRSDEEKKERACGCCVHGPRSKNSKAKDEAEGKEEAVEEWNRKMWRRL